MTVSEPLAESSSASRTVGRYVLGQELPRPGPYETYLAIDPALSRQVVLQLLRRSDADERASQLADDLTAQAQILAKLSHPNVVQIHDVGVDDGLVFVALEFVRGSTLGEWTKQSTRSWHEILRVLIDAGRGLAGAHEVGVSHGALREDSIVVGEDGRARVRNFGATYGAELDAPIDAGPVSPMQHDVRRFCSVALAALFLCDPLRADGRPRPYHELVRHSSRGSPPRRLYAALVRGLSTVPRSSSSPNVAAELVARLEAIDRPRRVAWFAAAGVVAAALSAFYVSSDREDECQRDGLGEHWNESARQGIRAAFERVELPFARRNVSRVVERLDQVGGRWQQLHQDVCVALGAGKAAPRVLQQELACLDRVRGQITTTIELLRNVDDDLAIRAGSLVNEIDVDACTDVDTLLSVPENPRVAKAVADVHDRLGKLEVLHRAADYAAVADEIEAVLETAQGTGHDPVISETRSLQARSELALGNHQAAQVAAEEAHLAAVRADDARASMSALEAGRVAMIRGRNDEAAVWIDLAKAEYERNAPNPEIEIALHERQGELASSIGDVVRATEHYSAAEELWSKAFPDRPTSGALLNRFGLLYGQLGNYEQALSYFERALKETEASLGPEHPECTIMMNNIALTLERSGRFEDAEAAHRRTLARREEVLGAEHPWVAITLTNLALVVARDDRDAARALHERALQIRERRLEADDPNIAVSLVMLSELHDEEAAKEALLGRALDILDRPQSSSFELGVALSEMGRLRHEQGRLQEALQLCERALQTQQRALGSAEHRELAYPLVRLSRVLMDLERPRDALPLLERALAVQRETPFDPIATEARFELGKALLTIDPASGRGQTLAREAVAAFRDENSGYAAEAEQWLRDHGIAIDRAP